MTEFQDPTRSQQLLLTSYVHLLKSNKLRAAYADILMLRQIIDCKEMLGLETTLDEEESVENKVLDYNHKDAFK